LSWKKGRASFRSKSSIVKYKAFKDTEIPRSLINFCTGNRPAEALMVNLSLKKKTRVGDTAVFAIPYWELFQKVFCNRS
jgi:hypothetical protein